MKTEEEIRNHIEHLKKELDSPFYSAIAQECFRIEISILEEVLSLDKYREQQYEH